MKIHLFIITLILFELMSFGQDCDEFKIHQKSIDSTFYPGHIIDRNDTVFNANSAFVNYTISNLLKNESDKCFISNRNLLNKLNLKFCNDSSVIISDKLLNGKQCEITINTSAFNCKKHQILTNSDTTSIESIDGQFPYGGNYSLPLIQISELKITIQGKALKIPKMAYSNLYEPNLCKNNGFLRKIEAYESLNGQYLYIYIYGGNVAGTYFSKLIFDKTKYITKIECDYCPLSIYSSFRKNFIGY